MYHSLQVMPYYFAESLNIGQNKERTFYQIYNTFVIIFLFHPDRYTDIVFNKGVLLV